MSLAESFEVTAPVSDDDFEQMYDLRWRVLRAPWNQPKGSEQVPDDASAFHVIVKNNNRIVATGRIHWIDETTAQIRFMAVDPACQKMGLGSKVLRKLEETARQHQKSRIILQAREEAVPFYKSRNYHVIEKTNLLFGVIQHYLMEKRI